MKIELDGEITEVGMHNDSRGFFEVSYEGDRSMNVQVPKALVKEAARHLYERVKITIEIAMAPETEVKP